MKDLTDFKPKRILACQLRQIGDVLLATPSLQLLKERYPDAELHLLTEKKCAPVLENNPHVDHVWEIDKKALKNPFKALAFYSKVGRSGYDLIVDFQQLPRCRWVILFSRAKVKLTMPPPWYNKPFYTHWGKTIYGYAAMCKASVIRPLGIEWNGERPKIWLSEAEKAWADKFIEQHGMQDKRFVTIDPSHRRITRLWPARHFAGLIKLIREQHPNLKFFMLYGPGEKDVAEDVAAQAGEGSIVSDHMLSLREMAAVQARAALHIGNCSAPRHFAVAVDTPSLVIHGATGFGWRFPSDEHISLCKDIECKSCNKNQCDTRECLEEFYPEDCIESALKLLKFKMS
ncbi:glycosyltransferase family 9 protein [uncultured Pseudodesulfovibrio sp.]|uniref:glycosyltransferase family 9 protein n=1 Tax=uncultured Pseudodesulfovibrio sp. TaxID=2035858 RepID=UPI0029C8284F|nr:glycosyltransferase family 9 protein [uncultured Pseudodesulfovibrio sp.]